MDNTNLHYQDRGLLQILLDNSGKFAPVIANTFFDSPPHVFDFTSNNEELNKINLDDIGAFKNYVENKLRLIGAKIGIGGYGEDRILYKNSKLFNDGKKEPRSVHLAIDLWMPAYTKIFVPLAGIIHSFQDNANYLDYGPTIILEHKLEGARFYTLYGHLSRKCLRGLAVSQTLDQGELIAQIGNSQENGQWPPHLHFQIIDDLLGKKGDFPGVVKPSEKKYYLALCPNPNLILGIKELPLH